MPTLDAIRLPGWADGVTINVNAVLLTLALLIGTWIVVALTRRVLGRWFRSLGPRFLLPIESVFATGRLMTGALWVLAALLILDLWGVSVSGLWTLLVSAAAIIGVGFLATWSMISNITASLFITLWRPFSLGETVEVLPEALKGRVIDRNLMFVVVRENSGTLIYVPNNIFFQKTFRVSDTEQKTTFESLAGC